MTLQACRELARQVDQPFHLGITEAGGQRSGTVKSSIGLGSLLMEGIGDTIRVSLASDPVEEVKVGSDLLKALGLEDIEESISWLVLAVLDKISMSYQWLTS